MGHVREPGDLQAGEARGDAGDVDEAGDAAADGTAESAEAEGIALASGMGSEGGDDCCGPQGARDDAAPASEEWREAGGGRVPSLAAPSAAEAEESGYAGLYRVHSEARAALPSAHEQPSCWGWSGEAGDGVGGAERGSCVVGCLILCGLFLIPGEEGQAWWFLVCLVNHVTGSQAWTE
mgnify:CR=1 FL=1